MGWRAGLWIGCGALLATTALALALEAAGSPTASPSASAADAPNFVFVLVDDQATNSFHRRFMPQTFHWIVDPGTAFTSAVAAPPLCCPDRAGLLTGQYPHNDGVWSNHPGYGALTGRSNTLPSWLQRAGYETGYFGKFLNHYSAVRGRAPAPGFDRWFAFMEESSTYYDYRVSVDGFGRSYGHDRSDYSTDVLTRQARAFIREQADSPRPFFAQVAYSAPHGNELTSGPCTGQSPVPPDAETLHRFAGEKLPRPPGFNEADVTDKPPEVARLPRLDAVRINELAKRWRCTLAAMSEVDVGVGQLMSELQDDGVLDDTIVMYLSDNGMFFGEHRLPGGKGLVYEPALRVPFAVYVPPAFQEGPPPPVSGAVVTNQDVAPTILDYANRFAGPASPCNPPGDCRRMDGRSLAPLLGGPGSWPPGRGALAEIDARKTTAAERRRIDPECNCAYEAVRTHHYVYAVSSTGDRELYDLARDPNELLNRIDSSRYAGPRRRLAARLASLERCSGQPDREPPAGTPFCQ